jgi:hypothetical protein
MRFIRLLAVAVLCATLALGAQGCFRIGVTVGAEIPPDHIARIVPGETTKDDVLNWFGAPSEATDGEIFARLFDVGEIAAEDLVALPFSDLLVYEITDGRARILFTFVFNWAEVKLKRDRLMVFFDENDVVLYYGITRQRTEESADEEDADVAVSAGPPPKRSQQIPRVGMGPGKR